MRSAPAGSKRPARASPRSAHPPLAAGVNHLDLAAFHYGLQALEIFRPIFFDPGQQRPGIVETDVDTGVPLQSLKEWQIATRVGLLKNVADVAARLMDVDE